MESPASEASPALQGTLDSLRAAFLADPMPPADSRRASLKKLKDALLLHKDSLAAAVSRDFGGHSADEVMIAEIFPLITALRDSIKRVGRWMKPSPRHVNAALQPSRARVIYQPVGVVGIITPWNYPLLLSIGPLINIIAAGNRAMIKMSEFSPATSQALREMLREAFPADHVAVVSDDSPGLAEVFSQLHFDHLVFTGSTRVGRIIMKAAADKLVPLTLELGGKSPVIIGEDAPIATAVERICWGKSLKSGQSCTAPDYVLCPRTRVDEFVQAFDVCFSRMFPTLRDNPDRTSIANDRQYQRLLRMLDDAEVKGARLIRINPAGEDLVGTRKLPTTLVLGATEDMLVMQEEIFGPILPVLPYDRIDDAIAYVNQRPRPLALYLFSYDSALQKRLVERTHSGGVSLNDTMTHAGVDSIPFGGIGESGMGHYHGREGFVAFSKAKGVFAKGRFNGGRAVYAPYGRFVQRMSMWLTLR